ncbi:hypothetical protein HJ160_03825 [Vibrio parahaemolyticus]|nr:hypothetical protein [Vibrio parahaemolyticus]
MNPTTFKQIHQVMAFYNKRGIPYRRKQLQRLMTILDDIFAHEPYLGEQIHRIGRRQVIGYWERTKHESSQVRKEKYRILEIFFLSRLPKSDGSKA